MTMLGRIQNNSAHLLRSGLNQKRTSDWKGCELGAATRGRTRVSRPGPRHPPPAVNVSHCNFWRPLSMYPNARAMCADTVRTDTRIRWSRCAGVNLVIFIYRGIPPQASKHGTLEGAFYGPHTVPAPTRKERPREGKVKRK